MKFSLQLVGALLVERPRQTFTHFEIFITDKTLILGACIFGVETEILLLYLHYRYLQRF